MSIRYSTDEIENKEKIIIFGAGIFGKYISSYIEKKLKRNILGFCDNNCDIWGKIFLNKRIYSLNELVNMKIDFTYVVAVLNPKEKIMIMDQLRKSDINENFIVVPLPGIGEKFYDEEILAYKEFALPTIKKIWKSTVETKGSVMADFFLLNEISRILIYGDLETAEFIKNELKESQVEVLNCIYDIVILQREQYDAVVVADGYRFDFIEEYLMDFVKCPIINIREVIKW